MLYGSIVSFFVSVEASAFLLFPERHTLKTETAKDPSSRPGEAFAMTCPIQGSERAKGTKGFQGINRGHVRKSKSIINRFI